MIKRKTLLHKNCSLQIFRAYWPALRGKNLSLDGQVTGGFGDGSVFSLICERVDSCRVQCTYKGRPAGQWVDQVANNVLCGRL